MASLWRRAFDALERPVAAGAEAWVQSDTFMEVTSVGLRLQRQLLADVHRASTRWLHLWGLSSRADVVRLMNQVGSLERELRELRRDLAPRQAAPSLLQPTTRRAA